MKTPLQYFTIRNLALASSFFLYVEISAQSYDYKSSIGLPVTPGQFRTLSDVAVDVNNNVFVIDSDENTIQKFSSTGVFISKWGSLGTGDGQFNYPIGLVIDAVGDIYVADSGNSRIQKFTNAGIFKSKWGSFGTGDGQFSGPIGLVIDATGDIYVADAGNSRIQKFTNTGTFKSKWGSSGTGDGQFNFPHGLAIDPTGDIYVADSNNNRIQKFTNGGVFVSKWSGSGADQLSFPWGLATDAAGDIYVSDSNNGRMQKFTSTGTFISKWGSSGSGDGQFSLPRGIAVDVVGNVYVADWLNHRIQKFNSTGVFLLKWGTLANGDAQFVSPQGVATDVSGNIYVVDTGNSRIQKFSSTGVFITKWGTPGTGDGQFNNPTNIATDVLGNIYVVDEGNNRIQKFSSTGVFITKWGTPGNGDGQFNSPRGIATDLDGSIFVVDGRNYRIQKFNSSGIFILKWGSNGAGDGQFRDPVAIASDQSGNIYVADPNLSTIQKFSNTGAFLTKWGSSGNGDGQFSLPFGVATDVEGNVFVMDWQNFRIQKFNNNGDFITKWGSRGTQDGQFYFSKGIATGSEGNIYVVDNNRVQIFESPLITQTTYPGFFTVGDPGLQVSISVKDINVVQDVKFISRGITQEETDVQTQNVNFTTASNTITFTIAGSYFKDPLALYSWFVVTDKLGKESMSVPKYIYLKYPASSKLQAIPGITPGRKVSNYQMISIPLKLKNQKTENIFKDLGKQADNKWRLFSYNSATLQAEPNPSSISEGQGYWLIVRDQNVINPGEGTTVEVTNSEPFIMKLEVGWNFIGNPYNFPISWDDVLEYNGNPANVKNLRQFISGAVVDEKLLAPYRGAFVNSDVNIDIKIPIINRGSGGRKKQDDKSPIDSKKWTVNFSLDDGEFRNELFGFGMNPRAIEDLDEWDETNLPILEGMSSFEMKMRTIDQEILVKDFVPTQDRYTWETQLSNSKNVTLKWDNSYFGESEKQLVIDDSELVDVVDMRSTNQLTLAPGNHQIRIHYGDQQYIKDQIIRESVAFGYVSPNPIKQGDQQIQIAANLPEGKYEVSFELIDITGKRVVKSGDTLYQGGRYTLVWQSDFSNVKPGLYLLRVESQGNGSSNLTFRKLIIQ